jgi:hypothetical protein
MLENLIKMLKLAWFQAILFNLQQNKYIWQQVTETIVTIKELYFF